MKAKSIRPVVLKKLHRLLDICVEVSNQPIRMVLSNCRKRDYVRVRKVFCRLAIDMVEDNNTHTSTTELGLFLDVDHSTIVSNVKDWEFQVKCDKEMRELYLTAKQLFEDISAPVELGVAV